ncbi:MAG TPA: NAD-dependent epimerase/dehydratase family protein, partial [Gammaproteobacteria bacterium]|nr:NAD-dependent epimerase/dehydratase family protein [Gammaproteobacteria bacterium]
MRILILGANGFIGSHLTEGILANTDWQIHAIDLTQDKLTTCLNHPRFHFKIGDITQETSWINNQISQCDAVLPLVAVANPAVYVQKPLKVFELDFEANLDIIRQCVA